MTLSSALGHQRTSACLLFFSKFWSWLGPINWRVLPFPEGARHRSEKILGPWSELDALFPQDARKYRLSWGNEAYRVPIFMVSPFSASKDDPLPVISTQSGFFWFIKNDDYAFRIASLRLPPVVSYLVYHPLCPRLIGWEAGEISLESCWLKFFA